MPADSAVTSFTLQLEGNKCLTWFGYPNKSTKFEHVYIMTHYSYYKISTLLGTKHEPYRTHYLKILYI